MAAENGDRPRLDPELLQETERAKERILRHIENFERQLREALKTQERGRTRWEKIEMTSRN